MMNAYRYASISLALAWFLSGCSTTTRLGGLVPAHHLSDQREGAVVWLHIKPPFAPVSPPPPEGVAAASLPTALPASVGALLPSFLVGGALDFVQTQLQAEAQRYDASFSAKGWAETSAIFKTTFAENAALDEAGEDCKIFGGRASFEKASILVSRWVDGSGLSLSGVPEGYEQAVRCVKRIVMSSVAGSFEGKDYTDLDNLIGEKKLAFAYSLEIDRAKGVGSPPVATLPFLVRPLWKWQWLSKAKVVSFSSPNPLAWPAGLLFKTGSEVEYVIYLTIDALLNTRDGIPQMITIGLTGPVQGPERFDLSGDSHVKVYSTHQNSLTRGWFVIPGYPQTSNNGYFSFQLTVNESDPSNVKKTLLKGSDYLSANKSSLVNRLLGGQD